MEIFIGAAERYSVIAKVPDQPRLSASLTGVAQLVCRLNENRYQNYLLLKCSLFEKNAVDSGVSVCFWRAENNRFLVPNQTFILFQRGTVL